jgi:hypothetical protein
MLLFTYFKSVKLIKYINEVTIVIWYKNKPYVGLILFWYLTVLVRITETIPALILFN